MRNETSAIFVHSFFRFFLSFLGFNGTDGWRVSWVCSRANLACGVVV